MDWYWLGYLSVPVLAHVLYGIPTADGGGIVTLHNGDDFSSDDEPPRLERLKSVRAVSRTHAIDLAPECGEEASVRIATAKMQDRPSWVVVETPRTFIELAPESFESYLQHEGLTHVVEQRRRNDSSTRPGREIYSKYSKTALNSPDGGLQLMTDAVGLPIEIVPLKPARIQAGDEMDIQVLVQSEPAPDVQLRVSHRRSEDSAPVEDRVMRTDGNGLCVVTIGSAGLWRLHSISMKPCLDTGEADWESVWASLTFRL